MYVCIKNSYPHAYIHIHIFIYMDFCKRFLKQLCKKNGICRIIVLVAAIYYDLIVHE